MESRRYPCSEPRRCIVHEEPDKDAHGCDQEIDSACPPEHFADGTTGLSLSALNLPGRPCHRSEDYDLCRQKRPVGEATSLE